MYIYTSEWGCMSNVYATEALLVFTTLNPNWDPPPPPIPGGGGGGAASRGPSVQLHFRGLSLCMCFFYLPLPLPLSEDGGGGRDLEWIENPLKSQGEGKGGVVVPGGFNRLKVVLSAPLIPPPRCLADLYSVLKILVDPHSRGSYNHYTMSIQYPCQ